MYSQLSRSCRHCGKTGHSEKRVQIHMYMYPVQPMLMWRTGKSKSKSKSKIQEEAITLYWCNGDVLFHVECCIRQLG